MASSSAAPRNSATRPRNFAAMREDRVLAMAKSAFGREFGSKKVAIEALATLPVDKQHALKKPDTPGKAAAASGSTPERPRKAKAPARSFEHMKRGGVAPAPSANKLVDASEASVRRLATATTGIPAKSKAQALTLLAKYGSTDIAKEAGRALGTSDVLRDNRLAKMSAPKQMPVRAVAPVAPLPQPPSPLSAPAGGNAFAIPRVVGTAALAGGAAVMAGAAYRDARSRGESQGRAVLEGAKAGAVPAAVAAAPTIARHAAVASEAGFAVARGGMDYLMTVGGQFDNAFGLAIGSKMMLGGGALGVAAKGVEIAARVASRAALPVLAAAGAVQGAREDQNMTRGAARGAIRALDPSTLATAFMADKRSLGERVFDRTFGAAAPKTGSGAYIDNAAAQKDASAAPARTAPQRQSVAASQTYKNTWTDSRGRHYERHDLTVRSAA